jgi:hypothetical protein
MCALMFQNPGHKSARELYRPSDRRYSAKLVPTFADGMISRSQRGGSPRAVISVSRPELLLFLPSSSSIVLTRLSAPLSRPTTSQKNPVAPGILPGPLDLQP